jgi:DNA invertase Pin-like site-specific DNA recombinase
MILDDLGFPGTSSVDRPGFLRLVELLEQSEVGLVLVRDLTRLSRDSASLERFMTDAVRRGVLVYADGRICGPGDF